MDARDYLWIYAHHKVVYYVNYLVIELLRLAYKLLHLPSRKPRKHYKLHQPNKIRQFHRSRKVYNTPELTELFNYDMFVSDSLDKPALIAIKHEANKKHCEWKNDKKRSKQAEKKIHQRFEILYEEFFLENTRKGFINPW